MAIADAAEPVLDEVATTDDELELVRVLDELRVEDDVDARLVVEAVDLALLVLGKGEEGDEDELAAAEPLGEMLDDALAREEAATGVLEDEEAAIEISKEDELAELLGMVDEIDVLALFVLLEDLLSRCSSILTCLRPLNWSRKRYSGT